MYTLHLLVYLKGSYPVLEPVANAANTKAETGS